MGYKKRNYSGKIYGPENQKISWPKKIMKSNKSISRKKFFDQNPFFAISKLAKIQFFIWEKV